MVIIMHRLGDRIAITLITVFLLAVVAVILYPVMYIMFASVSDGSKLAANGGLLWHPLGFSLMAYQKVFTNSAIMTGYENSMLLVLLAELIGVPLTTIAAYVLSRKNVLWNKFFWGIILFTMFFSGGLIPRFLIVKQLNLLNTPWSIVLPFAINTFYLIILRTAFEAVPEGIEEAARIDGAGHLRLLVSIIVPLSKPILAVIMMYSAVDIWNSWFTPAIFLTKQGLFPLQLVLREMLINDSVNQTLGGTPFDELLDVSKTVKYAAVMVSTLPVLLIYPFLQKYFVKAVLVGGIKE